jgi:TRAP-type mannitol/chloroaromatic compound transport system permease large subunit
MSLIMLGSFFILMFSGLPLYLSLVTTALTGIIALGDWSLIRVLAQQFYGGMDSFALMAIPFFVLTGILMNKSGLTDRLMEFSRLLVGSVRGGLGYVNVVAGIVLAGVNGSAAADASALGTLLQCSLHLQGNSKHPLFQAKDLPVSPLFRALPLMLLSP